MTSSGKQENMFLRKDTGARYLAYRPTYPPALYEHILAYHDSSAEAERDFCIDIGCGPGIVTRAIAPQFKRTLGVDPSDSMIQAAKGVEGQQGIEYAIGNAEDLKDIKDGSVDLVIGGTMAHWLDPEPFYTEMSRILKPGGTIAVFTYAWAQPAHNTKNYTELRKLVDSLHNKINTTTGQKGNMITQSLYSDLARPSDFSSTAPHFEDSVYQVWDADEAYEKGEPYFMAFPLNIKNFMNWLSTAGPMVKMEEMDPEGAQKYKEQMMKKFLEVGDLKEDEEITIVRSIGLVMVKKK